MKRLQISSINQFLLFLISTFKTPIPKRKKEEEEKEEKNQFIENKSSYKIPK